MVRQRLVSTVLVVDSNTQQMMSIIQSVVRPSADQLCVVDDVLSTSPPEIYCLPGFAIAQFDDVNGTLPDANLSEILAPDSRENW
ncbi:hypothetical protein [Candidatus Burkholderia verschuerenii]|uniref:hypothetical protein n=1 Tax=Candidatus Burkholderia verschuerenii TaxID=242163 RepID=UPI0012EE35C2|nr:hypothetical protein [Candidatus Burkholderia verschuerenii]